MKNLKLIHETNILKEMSVLKKSFYKYSYTFLLKYNSSFYNIKKIWISNSAKQICQKHNVALFGFK